MTLVILLSLLGISAIQAAAQQQRMVVNQLALMRAFESAERLLLLGESRLPDVALCDFCLPPPYAPGQVSPGVQWLEGSSGLYALQNLGENTEAAHMPAGLTVTLFRVTAVGLERQSRVVLESIYAWPEASSGIPPRRIAWRQVL